MNPQEQLEQLYGQVQEMLQAEILDWPGLEEKLRQMRDVIGPNLPQPIVNPYGEIVEGVNPSFLGWSATDASNWNAWCKETWFPE